MEETINQELFVHDSIALSYFVTSTKGEEAKKKQTNKIIQEKEKKRDPKVAPANQLPRIFVEFIIYMYLLKF